MKRNIIFAICFLATTFATQGVAEAQYANVTYPSTICTQDAYVCPNGTTVGRTGSNCQFVCPSNSYQQPYYTNQSYTYTQGCYTYYYNGVTRSTSVIGNSCQTSTYTYTYATQPTYYYTYQTSPYYTYNQNYGQNYWYQYGNQNTYYYYPNNNYQYGYTYYGNTTQNTNTGCFYVNGAYACY